MGVEKSFEQIAREAEVIKHFFGPKVLQLARESVPGLDSDARVGQVSFLIADRTGISAAYLTELLRGRTSSNISLDYALRIAAAINLRLDEVITSICEEYLIEVY